MFHERFLPLGSHGRVRLSAGPAGNGSSVQKQYKLSVVPGATSGWGMTGTFFADLVRERSQGRINIKVYHSSQLLAGKQTSEFLLLRNGAIDFALASTINWSPPDQGTEPARPALLPGRAT